MNRSFKVFCLLVLLTVFVFLVATLPILVASTLGNYALIRVLSASPCDPSWHFCAAGYRPYPPWKYSGNVVALQTAQDMITNALAFSPQSASLEEHLVELQFAAGELDAAAHGLAGLLEGRALRGTVLRDGNYVFHLLRSRVSEAQGDIVGAIKDAHRGLGLADFRLDTGREQSEIRRLAALYARRAQRSGHVASDAYEAGFYAACAAQWTLASDQMRQLTQQPQSAWNLSVEQRAMQNLIMAFGAQRASLAMTADQWLARVGVLDYDPQFDDQNPYLWLANTLRDADPTACWYGALSIYEWYADINPKSGQGPYLIGTVYYLRRDWRTAANYHRRAIDYEPLNSLYTTNLALTYESQGDLVGAIAWYKRSIELWPTNGYYYARLGRVHHAVGQDQAALAEFDRAIELAPSEEEVLVWAGYFYLDYGLWDKAYSTFESVLSLNPGNIYAKRGLDLVFANLKDRP